MPWVLQHLHRLVRQVVLRDVRLQLLVRVLHGMLRRVHGLVLGMHVGLRVWLRGLLGMRGELRERLRVELLGRMRWVL